MCLEVQGAKKSQDTCENKRKTCPTCCQGLTGKLEVVNTVTDRWKDKCRDEEKIQTSTLQGAQEVREKTGTS